ncbi:MAG: glycosyl hydrolase [Bacteroidota bacterium]
MKPTNFLPHFSQWLALLFLTFFLGCSERTTQQTGMNDPEIDRMLALINTEIDPEYVYEYEKTKYVPPAGKTLLVMGQTVERVNEYMDSFPDQPIPGGWSAYGAVTEFVGITENNTNQTGTTQNHQMLVDRFPNTALHTAMWMVGTWDVAERTYNGEFDTVIHQFSQWFKTLDRPVYLRIGYEFDGPHNEMEPEDYVKAYHHIVDYFRAEGVDNVAYVWHSYAAPPYKGYSVTDWYPGDDYVDWVALSLFFQPYAGPHLNPEGNALVDFAKAHKKPVMLAETNPVNGIEKEGTEIWDTWFKNFFTIAYEKNVKAICFINEDWTNFNVAGLESWKDARLYNNSLVSKAWFEETNKDRYLKQSDDLFEQLDY